MQCIFVDTGILHLYSLDIRDQAAYVRNAIHTVHIHDDFDY